MRMDAKLTRKRVQSRNGQFHVNELEILTESVDNQTRVCLGEEGHRSTGKQKVNMWTISSAAEREIIPENCIKQRVVKGLSRLWNHRDDQLPCGRLAYPTNVELPARYFAHQQLTTRQTSARAPIAPYIPSQ
jgi:hypothetical protein